MVTVKYGHKDFFLCGDDFVLYYVIVVFFGIIAY